MVEQFHQFHQGKFRIIAVHVVHLPPECLTERVAAKVLYLQAVFLLNLLQDYVYALNGEDRTFLTYQNRGFQSDWSDVSVTFPYMLL